MFSPHSLLQAIKPSSRGVPSLVPVGLVHQSRVLEGLIERRAKIGTRARPDDRHEQCRLDAVLHTEVHGDCAVLQVEKLNER